MVAPGGYDAIIAAASRKYGVPESYIRSVMQVESGGRADALGPVTRSGQRAGGVMQIMPATYAEIAEREGLGPDRMDPANSIMAGTAYLRQNYDRFGDWGKTFAAYNAGPGAVERGGPLPAETRAYVPKVQAGIQGADVAGYRTSYNGPGATYEAGPEFSALLDNIRQNGPSMNRRAPGTFADATGMDPEREAELRAMIEREQLNPPGARGSLLDVDSTNNWMDGLGGLLGSGQTSSQPPGPSISPLQYQLAGAGNAVGQLAGVTNRRVGIGELLAALGGGLTQGAAAGQQAQRQQRADQRAETGERFDNLYKFAAAQKALQPDRMNLGDRFKVAGKRIFDAATQTWIDDPNAPVDQGGPLEGTGIDAQMYNAYVTLSHKQASGQVLTPQETTLLQLSQRHLTQPRVVPNGEGGFAQVDRPPLPNVSAAPPPVTPPPGPDLLDTQQPPAGAGAPPAPSGAPASTVTPSGVKVTQIVPPRAKEIPATAQTAMLGNVAALRKVSDAVQKVGESSWTTGNVAGLFNMLPGDTVNNLLPGDEGRAALADIGSMIIHDRSGAAVTLSEFPRLRPFVPAVSDSADTVKMKLGRLQTEIEDMLRDQSSTYSADENYRENPVVREVVKTIRPRAPMSGGEDNPEAARRRAKYGLE